MNFAKRIWVIFIVTLLTGLSLSGCVKEKLRDDAAILIGNWKCVSIVRLDYDLVSNTSDTIEVFNESTINLEMSFLERGRACLFKDGKRIGSSRIEEWASSHLVGVGNYVLTCPKLSDYLNHEYFLSVYLPTEDLIQTSSLKIIDESDLADNQHYEYFYQRID